MPIPFDLVDLRLMVRIAEADSLTQGAEAAHRHAQTMGVAIVPLADPWAERAMQIVVRSLEALPAYARELVDLLVADAQQAGTS